MGLEVRRLGVGDAELLQEACCEIRAETVSVQRCREWLANPANVVVLARRDGALCGWVNGYRLQRFSRDELFLFEVDTLSAHRRRGVATALVEALKAMCREQGIDEMFVFTGALNEPTMALYRRTGATCEGHDRDVMWTWEGLAAARPRAGRRDAGEG